MLSHAQKLQLQTNNGIVLCRGVNAAGEKFWLYIKATREAIARMSHDYQQKKPVDFLSYGEVVYKGISDTIPDDIKQAMETEYHFKHPAEK